MVAKGQITADVAARLEQEKCYGIWWFNRDHKRARYQEMAAGDLITFKELRPRLAELEETRKTVEKELAALRSHEGYVRGLERDRDALLDSLEAAAPKMLDSLTPKERPQLYKVLRTTAAVEVDGTVVVSWAGEPAGEPVCETAALSPATWRRRTCPSGLGTHSPRSPVPMTA
ncbi:MAG: hypothetical protein M3220_11705 [Chloroflexota bacterium]|nr:hypothetical protein [Chloroflexota bacterium]